MENEQYIFTWTKRNKNIIKAFKKSNGNTTYQSSLDTATVLLRGELREKRSYTEKYILK